MADSTERGTSSETKGSLSDKRKGVSGAPAAHSMASSSLGSGNGSYRPAQASSPGARVVAGATASSSAGGSVIPPPVAEVTKGGVASPAASLELLAERYAALAEDATFSADDAVDRQIAGLEEWCRAAIWRDRRDLSRFWVLRAVAFVGATVASAAPYLPGAPPALALSAGTLAVLALAIDSAWPAADRASRHRAVRELRELQHTLRLKWDKVRLAHPERFSPKRIAHALALLDAAQAKREEIGGYLTDSSPGV